MAKPPMFPIVNGDNIIDKHRADQAREFLTPELDPVRDLTVFERAAKDQMASQGPGDLTPVYFTGKNLNKTTEQIITDQFGPKAEFLDGLSKTLGDATQVSRHEGILSSIDMAGDISGTPPAPHPPQAQDPGFVDPKWYGPSDEYNRVDSQLQSEIGREPSVPQPHEPGKPDALTTAMAVLVGLTVPGSAAHIANGLFQGEAERRQYLDKLDMARYQAQRVGHDNVVKALEHRLATVQNADEARLRAKVQEANNYRNSQTSQRNTDARIDAQAERQQRAIDARMEIARMNDQTKNRLIDLRDDPGKQIAYLVGELHYDPGMARDMVYSEDLNRIARTAKTKIETTYLERSLDDRLKEASAKAVNTALQGALIKSRTQYYEALVKYMPESQALRWAALNALIDYRDRSLGLREDQYDTNLDTETDAALQKAYDAAMEQVYFLKRLIGEGVDENGKKLTDDKLKVYQARIDVFNNTARRAKAAMDEAAKKREQAKAKTTRRRSWQDVMKGRPSPLPGKVPRKGTDPVDPTQGGFYPYDEKKLGGSSDRFNDYL